MLHNATTTARELNTARRNCAKSNAHQDGRDEMDRQIAESLAFMDYQAAGYSWAESMKMARADVALKFAV